MPPTLRFRTPGNERVVLDQAATKASISHVKECLLALSFLQGKLEACQTNGGVDVLLDDISPALGVMEHKWTALVELLSVPSAIARNVAERSAALREANMKIRSLEEKLGSEITGEQVQCALYNASEAPMFWPVASLKSSSPSSIRYSRNFRIAARPLKRFWHRPTGPRCSTCRKKNFPGARATGQEG